MPILTPSPCLTPQNGRRSPGFRTHSRNGSSASRAPSPTPSASASSNLPSVTSKLFNATNGQLLFAPLSPVSDSPPTYFRVAAFRLQAHSSVLASMLDTQMTPPLTPPSSDDGRLLSVRTLAEALDGVKEPARPDALELPDVDAKVLELLLTFMHPPARGISAGYTQDGGMDLHLQYDLAIAFLKAVHKYEVYAALPYAIETMGAHLDCWPDRAFEVFGLAHHLGLEELTAEAAEKSVNFDISRVEPELMQNMGSIPAVEIYRHHALHARRRRVIEGLLRSISRLPPPSAVNTMTEHGSGVCWAELSMRWASFCDDLLNIVDSRFDWHNDASVIAFVDTVECPACAEALKDLVARVEMPPRVPRFASGMHVVPE